MPNPHPTTLIERAQQQLICQFFQQFLVLEKIKQECWSLQNERDEAKEYTAHLEQRADPEHDGRPFADTLHWS